MPNRSKAPYQPGGPEVQTTTSYGIGTSLDRTLSHKSEKLSPLESPVSDDNLDRQTLLNTPITIDTPAWTISRHQKHREGLTQSLRTIDAGIDAFITRHQYTMLPDTFFGIPYPRNRWFTGRDAILSDIRALLVPQEGPTKQRFSESSQSSTAICVVHGLPGIGKTNLTIEFGYQQKHMFSHIFWISSDSEEKFDDGLFKIARSLRPVNNASMEDKEAIVNAALVWLKTPAPSMNNTP